ncbi:MAG: glycosyltransferase family 25 protein [Noviherbaspirillum sp.]
MITINCISLADQHERRAYMRRQLDACGLPYRFFDAVRVDPAQGWPAIYSRRQRLRHSGVDMRAGEMGCYLSHREIWKNFLAHDDALCLVLEDDVELAPDFAEVVTALCQHSADWEFVRLTGVFKRAAYPLRRLAGEHFLVDYLEQPNGTQGYLISRDAARRLLAYTENMAHAIDMAIDREWEHGVAIMGVVPGPIAHDEAFETTLGRAPKPKLSLRQKLMRELHRAGGNLRKQLFLARKKRRLRVSGNSRGNL